jgi:hypothetical protein
MRIGIAAEIEAKADHWLEIVSHQPRLDQRTLRRRRRNRFPSSALIHAWLSAFAVRDRFRAAPTGTDKS